MSDRRLTQRLPSEKDLVRRSDLSINHDALIAIARRRAARDTDGTPEDYAHFLRIHLDHLLMTAEQIIESRRQRAALVDLPPKERLIACLEMRQALALSAIPTDEAEVKLTDRLIAEAMLLPADAPEIQLAAMLEQRA